jgi:hypothetical protein
MGTAGDVDASSKFWICDTTLDILKFNEVIIFLFEEKKKQKKIDLKYSIELNKMSYMFMINIEIVMQFLVHDV